MEQLHKQSLEPKSTPKQDVQQKRQSGKPRKEYPLFDINPRAAKEFLERAKSENGVAGVTFQLDSGKEEFTQWKEEDEKTTKANEVPEVPPNSFSEALLRKLNIAPSVNSAGTGPAKPKLVAKSSHDKFTPFKYHKVPIVKRDNVREAWRPFFSTALWRVHELETNPLDPETYVVLTADLETYRTANNNALPAVSVKALRAAIQDKIIREDRRENAGMAEEEFPDVPRRVITPNAKPKQEVAPPQTNGHLHTYSDVEKRLEATALSAIEELLGGLEEGKVKEPQNGIVPFSEPAAGLRPSFSYAMAAGGTSPTLTKPTSPVSSIKAVPIETPSKILSSEFAAQSMLTENGGKVTDLEKMLPIMPKKRTGKRTGAPMPHLWTMTLAVMRKLCYLLARSGVRRMCIDL